MAPFRVSTKTLVDFLIERHVHVTTRTLPVFSQSRKLLPSFSTRQPRRVIRTTRERGRKVAKRSGTERSREQREERRERKERERSLSCSAKDTTISLVWCNALRKGRGVTELGKPTLVLCLCRCLPLSANLALSLLSLPRAATFSNSHAVSVLSSAPLPPHDPSSLALQPPPRHPQPSRSSTDGGLFSSSSSCSISRRDT